MQFTILTVKHYTSRLYSSRMNKYLEKQPYSQSNRGFRMIHLIRMDTCYIFKCHTSFVTSILCILVLFKRSRLLYYQNIYSTIKLYIVQVNSYIYNNLASNSNVISQTIDGLFISTKP